MNTYKLTAAQKNAIAKKYNKGASGADLAAEFGVSVTTILNALRAFSVKIRPRGRPKQIA